MTLSEKELKILMTFGRALPMMSDLDKERLLAFGEGVAFKAEQQYIQSQQANAQTVAGQR